MNNLLEEPENDFESDDSFDRETIHSFYGPKVQTINCIPIEIGLISFFSPVDSRISVSFASVFSQFLIYSIEIFVSESNHIFYKGFGYDFKF